MYILGSWMSAKRNRNSFQSDLGYHAIHGGPVLNQCRAAQYTRNIASALFHCWVSVADGGPTLNQHRGNVSCLLDTISTEV